MECISEISSRCHCRALSIKREPGTLQLLGVLYYHNNQLKEAELAWKEALQLEPSNIETRSNYVSKIQIILSSSVFGVVAVYYPGFSR